MRDAATDDLFAGPVTFSELNISSWEKMVLFGFSLLIVTILVVAAWSWILLYLGLETGGGPLGMLMRLSRLPVLLS